LSCSYLTSLIEKAFFIYYNPSSIINISSPITGDIIRANSAVNFVVDEIDGQDYLNNVTLSIQNSSSELSNIGTSGDPQHINNYLIPSTWIPAYLTVRATGFNNSIGSFKNATDSLKVSINFFNPLNCMRDSSRS